VIGFPVASTMVANLAPAALRGRYQGAFSMCWGIAFTLSPLGAGEAMQRLGARSLWLLCFAVSVAVSAGHLLTAEPRRRRIAALTQAELAQPPPDVATSGAL
jgi:MFS family permease